MSSIVLLWVSLSMLAKDVLSTFITIAEAKGRAVLAGGLDAVYDIAAVMGTLYGAGEILIHGWNLLAVEILIVMCVTSFIGTSVSTKLGSRIKEA